MPQRRAGKCPFLQAYISPRDLYDEMFMPTGEVRPHYLPVVRPLQMACDELDDMRVAAEQLLLHKDVNFNLYNGPVGIERIFPFDVIPRVIDEQTWSWLEAGLIRRVRALNAFVADVYSDEKF
jgi:uncharacterized circularly permuted ATP-grasp superfamily protein